MSKRCELQKEYYKEFGNYKGVGKYSDHYVKWLESRILALTIPDVVGQSEQLVCTCCGEVVVNPIYYTSKSRELLCCKCAN